MKNQKINFPADFHFENPELKEFSYNQVAMVQGASGSKKARTVNPGFTKGTDFATFSKPTSKKP